MRYGVMKCRKNRWAGIFAAAAIVCVGCAESLKQVESEAVLPEVDVIQVKENSDEALRLVQETKMELEVLSAKITEMDNRIILLSEEVSSISSARVEELEAKLALLTEAYKDLHNQLKAVEKTTLRTSVKRKPRKPSADATFSPASAADLVTSSPEYHLYQNGLKVFNSRNYQKALSVFSDLLSKFPEGSHRDNAHFWMGESYYRRGEFKKAISAFSKVFSFPNSSKADDAQFKIGLSYQKLGQSAKARAELEKLINRFPASEYVERARRYSSNLK
ncbi:MAG: tol-pal system protein YbgF [Chitinispirillaceae bacterium]